MTEEEEGGLSNFGISVLGFDEMCRCRHQMGLHDTDGSCAVLGCECKEFQPRPKGTV